LGLPVRVFAGAISLTVMFLAGRKAIAQEILKKEKCSMKYLIKRGA
jgi:hypothetical protein